MAVSNSEIKQYMSENKKYFEKSEIERFENIIAQSDITSDELHTFKFKSPQTAVVLSVLLGWLGVDRFYSGNYVMGALKLCTMGLSGLWWIIDWFLVGKAVKVRNQTNFYAFLNNQIPASSVNADTLKNIVQSKEVQSAVKDVVKSGKNVVDSMWE